MRSPHRPRRVPASALCLGLQSDRGTERFINFYVLLGSMGSFRQREPRRAVHLKARLRCDAGWSDVIIRNVSTRGLMLESHQPPARGTFIEVRRGHSCIVGQVRWSREGRFGIRSQSKIDAEQLLAERPGETGGNDRRARPRDDVALRPRISADLQHHRSRYFARLAEWAVVVIAVAFGAYVLATHATSALSRSLLPARSAFEGSLRD